MLNKKNSCANVFYQSNRQVDNALHQTNKVASLKQDKSTNSIVQNDYQLEKKNSDVNNCNNSQFEQYPPYNDYYSTLQYQIGSPKIETNNKENMNNLTGSSTHYILERPLKFTLENAINKAINQSEKMVSPKSNSTAKATPQSSGKKQNQSYFITHKITSQNFNNNSQFQQQQSQKKQKYQNQSQQQIIQQDINNNNNIVKQKNKTPIRSRSPISSTIDQIKRNQSKSQNKNQLQQENQQPQQHCKQSGHQACKMAATDSKYNSSKKDSEFASSNQDYNNINNTSNFSNISNNKIQRNSTSTSIYSKRQTVTNKQNIITEQSNNQYQHNKCEKKQQISIIPQLELQQQQNDNMATNTVYSNCQCSYSSYCSNDQIYKNPAFIDSIITNKDTLQFLKKNFLEYKNSQNTKIQCQFHSQKNLLASNYPANNNIDLNNSDQVIIGGSWNCISLDRFTNLLFQEFPEVLQDHSIDETVIEDLKQKVQKCLQNDETINNNNVKNTGCSNCQILSSGYLSLQKLQYYTKTTGLLGLILYALKEFNEKEKHRVEAIRNSFTQIADSTKACFMKSLEEKDIAFLFKQNDVQNIMNILQEFMESMFRDMENEVYTKFNQEMRRMVLKFKQTEKLLTIVNEKVTDNFDLFQQEAQNNAIIRDLKGLNESLNGQLHEMSLELVRKQGQIEGLLQEKERMQKEIEKVNERCDLFQNKILHSTNSASLPQLLQQQQQQNLQQQLQLQQQSPQQVTSESISESKAVVYPRYAQININTQNATSNAFSGIVTLDNADQVISPMRKFETNQATSPFKLNKQVETNCSSIINLSLTLLEELRIFTCEKSPATQQACMRNGTSLYEFQMNCQSQNSNQIILVKKLYRPLNFFSGSLGNVFVNFVEMFPLLRNPRVVSLEEIKIFLDFFYRISLYIYENKYNTTLNKTLKNYEEHKNFKVFKLPIVKSWNKIFCENNAKHLNLGVPSSRSNTSSECGQYNKLDDKLSGISSGPSSRQSSIINNNNLNEININFTTTNNNNNKDFSNNNNNTTISNNNTNNINCKKLDSNKFDLILSNEILANEIILILKDTMLSIDKKFCSEIQQPQVEIPQLFIQPNSSMCENYQSKQQQQQKVLVEHHKKNQSNSSNSSAFKYQKRRGMMNDLNEETIFSLKLKLYIDFLIFLHSFKLTDACYAIQELSMDSKQQLQKHSIITEINEFILDNEILTLIFVTLKKWQFDANLCELCLDYLSGFKSSGQIYLEYVKQMSQPFIIDCLIEIIETNQKKDVEKQCIQLIKTISYSINLQGQVTEKLKLMLNNINQKYSQQKDPEFINTINVILKNISAQN